MWNEKAVGGRQEAVSRKSRTQNAESGGCFSCLLLTAYCLLLSGCAAWKPLTSHEVQLLPESYQGYYDYPSSEIQSQTLSEIEKRKYVVRRVEFPLNLSGELQVRNLPAFQKSVEELRRTDEKTANDWSLRYTNRIDYYIPKQSARRPAILISPILGGNMVVDRFAAYYAKRGFVAAIVHRKRLYWEDDKDIEQVEEYLRTSVIRLRQALDWLSVQPEVDPGRIGAFGVSYGAVLHSVLAAVEPRIQYHVLALPAAPIADIILHCPEKQIKNLLRDVQKNRGWSLEEIHEKLQAAIRSDPLNFAPSVPRKKILMYTALFDRVVGTRRSLRVWRAFGKPELKIIPFGHYGGVVAFPFLQHQSYRAFKKHLR